MTSISASSLNPPNEILAYFLFNEFAIDLPSEVFPTPGGPYKQIIGDFMFFLSFKTDKYSIILSFTSSSPNDLCLKFFENSANQNYRQYIHSMVNQALILNNFFEWKSLSLKDSFSLISLTLYQTNL